MVNEIRYYVQEFINTIEKEAFIPQYIVTAIKLPSGAIKIAVNSTHIKEKLQYMLEAYDEEMRLKTNSAVVVCNLMVV